MSAAQELGLADLAFAMELDDASDAQQITSARECLLADRAEPKLWVDASPHTTGASTDKFLVLQQIVDFRQWQPDCRGCVQLMDDGPTPKPLAGPPTMRNKQGGTTQPSITQHSQHRHVVQSVSLDICTLLTGYANC